MLHRKEYWPQFTLKWCPKKRKKNTKIRPIQIYTSNVRMFFRVWVIFVIDFWETRFDLNFNNNNNRKKTNLISNDQNEKKI